MIHALWIIPIILIAMMIGFIRFPRLRIPRDLGREGLNDYESTLAYDRVSRSPIFSLIRFLALNQLKGWPPEGISIDAGCGPGYLAMALAKRYPELTVLGIDNAPDMLELAKRNRALSRESTQVNFLNGDIQNLALKDNSLDYVISTISLHHWPEPEKAFREIHRVLKPGGRFLICDLRRDMPGSLFQLVRFGQRFLAPPSIRRVNGGIGSVWSSYTPAEMETILFTSPFKKWAVLKGWGWAYIWGEKS